MKLLTARVTNFRSVEDSGLFRVDDVTCLVGKNEAGKTAILQAIAGLNPHPAAPITFNLERDYPRRFLNEYAERHHDGDAVVISTTWELNELELQTIEESAGPGALEKPEVTVFRRYQSKFPEWTLPLNYKKITDNLISDARLNAAERSTIGAPPTVTKLREILENIERTEKHNQLLARINALPGKNTYGLVHPYVSTLLPQFMYFSFYDRMVGQIRLDNYQTRSDGREQPPIEPGERVFIDFLSYAGTSIEEINAATTYEGLNAKCESASIRITDQLLEYWTQNPNLEIEVRVTKGEPNDPAPFNTGVIARARVKNNLHKVTVPFSERSAGFIWFFSFLVKFAEVKKTQSNLVLLLDEPGLTLHGKAQSDLIRYFEEKLSPTHQLIYSTHSPFMVSPAALMAVRLVEDKVTQSQPGRWSSDGTRVRGDALATDRDSLFPLQGALGYDITQTLFVGKNTLLVEGPSDILYLHAFSAALSRRGRKSLDPKWTLCPAGGLDKIQSFVSLFAGSKLNVAALTDYAKTDRKKHETFTQNRILESDRLLTFASILGVEEADVEDIFAPGLFSEILNLAFAVPTSHLVTPDSLGKTVPPSPRLLKQAEALFRLMPPDVPEFDHFRPAEWLFLHPELLDTDNPAVVETLDRAESVVVRVNDIPCGGL